MAQAKGKTAAKSAPKKTSSAKTSSSKTKAAAKTDTKQNEVMTAKFKERRRFWSLVMFFFGIFQIILTFIKGEGLWKTLYDLNRGLLGMSVFVFGLFVIYMALSIASEKAKNAVIARAFQGGVMFFLLSGAAQIFFGNIVHGTTLWIKIKHLYADGVKLKGGGVAGALLGMSLQNWFGEVGSKIIIVLFIVLFMLLLSDLTLPQIIHAMTRPIIGGAKALKENARDRAYERDLDGRYDLPEFDEYYDDYNYDYDYDDGYGYEPPPDYDDYEPEPPRPAKKPERRLKKRSVDFAKVHKAQLEQIRREEEEAKKRADKFADPNEVQPEVEPQTEEDDGFDPVSEGLDPRTVRRKRSVPVEEDEQGSESAETAEKPKKPPKEPTRAEQVREEKQKVAEEIKLKELIRQASAAQKRAETNADTSADTYSPHGEGEQEGYVFPPVDLLQPAKNRSSEDEIKREIEEKSQRLVATLEQFGVKTRIVGIHRGPTVTRYELQPAAGVKVKQVTSLSDDIALNLAAQSVRIEAPIPGKAAIGIEIPNIHRDSISMRELIDSKPYRQEKGLLKFAVGKDIEGNIVMGDITSMPHMLIAGTTGSGKSVFTNSIILNILFRCSPDEVKLILVDPKRVEFPIYNGIPHLLIPVLTEPLKAAGALGWAVNEMNRRYALLEANGVKNLEEYNEFVDEMIANDPECTRTKLPYIVIILDELAELMMAAKNEVEASIQSLAQLARAAGMHMLIATQSPRTDVLTGIIKANIPSRTALMVSNNVDSRVILDEVGAEKLLGKGDMLFKPAGYPKPLRIQSGFASSAEIRDIVAFLKDEHGAQYDQEVVHEVEQNMPKPKNEEDHEVQINPDDDLVNQAITIIVETGNASTAYLQRKLKLGFPRAARIMDDIEAMGIIGPQEGAKPRKILLTKEEWYERQSKN